MSLISIIEDINADLLSWKSWGDVRSNYTSNMLIFNRSIDAVPIDKIDIFNKLKDSYKEMSKLKESQSNYLDNNRARAYDVEIYKPTIVKLSSELVKVL